MVLLRPIAGIHRFPNRIANVMSKLGENYTSIYLRSNREFSTTRNTPGIDSVTQQPVKWPRKRINDLAITSSEFGGDFGNYKVVMPQPPSDIPQPLRTIPPTIGKPEYFRTGIPKLTYGHMPGRRAQQTEPVIKSLEQIDRLKAACKLAGIVLDAVGNEARVGITTNSLDEFAHNLIVSMGAYPSPLNYRHFPKSICTSVNNVVCHGIPDSRPLEDGDIVNIDVTVFLNGFHGDCSETYLIGSVDEMGRRLVEVTKECLQEGIGACFPNVPFRAIGRAIESLANARGFTVIPAFTGHGIGESFHEQPDIYHIDFDYDGIMKPGMAFTIEPILSQGGEVIEILEDGWTAVTIDHARTAQSEHTILITDTGANILTN